MSSAYTIHTAKPPKLGKCTVTPTQGVFMQDKFSVKCSGFSDNSDPLTYMFYLDPGNDTTSIHGETAECRSIYSYSDFKYSKHTTQITDLE